MLLNRLIASLLILVPTLVIADLSIDDNSTIVCNSSGNKGTPNTCPVDRGPSIVDTIKADQARGNPINVLTGNKFEQATDIPANNGGYSLSFNRYYNSKSTQRGQFGIGWRHNYEMQLQDIDNQIDILQADGRKLSFIKTAAALDSSTLFITRYIAEQPELGYLERTQSSDPTKAAWLWTLPTGKQFQFIAHRQTTAVNQLGQHRFGQLSRVTEDANNPSSPYWALTYGTDGTLAQVRNHTGDTLKFAYETTASNLPKISITSSSQNKANNGRWVYLLDQNNNLAQVVSPTGVRTGYQYNDPFDKHNLTAKFGYDNKSQAQLITEWQYDAYDRAISSSHKDGVEKVSVAYDINTVLPTKSGHIFTNRITNSVGENTDYRYQYKNGEAQLLSVIGPSCLTCGPTNVSYEYDSAGRITKTNKLNAQGQTVSSTATDFDTLGRTIKVTQTDKTDNNNQQTWLSYLYDNKSYPMQPTVISRPSVVEGKQAQTKLSYDEAGNITAMTQIGYQPATATSQAQPISRTTNYRYERINGKPQLVAVDGPLQGNQDTTRYQYDKHNQLTLISYPEGLTQQMSYDAQGRVTTLVNIDGTTNHYQYNAQDQVTQSNQAGQVSQIDYDPLGRIQQITDPLGQILSYQYDAGGQIIGMSDGKQAQIDLTRDTEGNLTAANLLVDGKVEQQTAFETLDATSKQDLLASIKAIAEGETGNSARPDIAISPYQKLGALLNQTPIFVQAQIEQTDAQGLITTYTADDFGNIVEVDSPTTGISTYQYNQNGLLIGSQSPLNAQTYQRDTIGRITIINVSSPDGSFDQHRIAWGKHNKPLKITYPDGEESFSYNENAQLLTHTQNIDEQHFTLTYSYDDQGRVETRTLPSGEVIKYTYNGDDKKKVGVLNGIYLKGIWDKPIITGLNSDSDTSLMQRFSFGNGISNLVQKDQNGRIVLAGNPKVGQTTLNYDPNQKQSEPEQVTQTASAQMGEAIQPQSGISQQVRTVLDQVLYDQNPEPLTIAQNDIIEQISQTPEMDEWGRTIKQGDQHYQYDSQNRLVNITSTDETGNLIPVADYRYNTFNQRIAKTTYSNQGNQTKTTYYFYDGNQLIAETVDTATQTAKNLKQYIWLNDTPIAVLQQGDLYYIHTDHRNAPIAVTDSISKLVWQADNEDFGYANINAKSSFDLNLRLSNQYYDSESGLHYNTNRYYDALNQQYLTPDPLGLAAGPDLFAFALNQPHSISDPDGLEPKIKTQADLNKASPIDKLQYIFFRTGNGIGGAIGKELLSMVSGPALATAAAIFVAYAIAQATPAGWVANAALVGVGLYFMGKAIWGIMSAIYGVAQVIIKPNCTISELDTAAKNLQNALAIATADIVAAGITGGTAKASAPIAKFIGSFKTSDAAPKLGSSDISKLKKYGVKYVAPVAKTLFQLAKSGSRLISVKVNSSTKEYSATAIKKVKDTLAGLDNYIGLTGKRAFKLITSSKESGYFATSVTSSAKIEVVWVSPHNGKYSSPVWPSNLEDRFKLSLKEFHAHGTIDGKKITGKDEIAYYNELYKKVIPSSCSGIMGCPIIEYRIVQQTKPASGDGSSVLTTYSYKSNNTPEGFVKQKLPAVIKVTDLATFNRMAENPLPNTTYEYGSYAWRTDSKGRVDQVSGTIDPKDHGRQTTGDITTTNIGKDKGSKTGDVGFHLIGNQFNGPINRLNVVPGNGKPANGVANLNQGAYASKFESKVKALSAAGKKVEVRIEPVYRSGNNTTRPDSFRTQYREVGTSRWTTNDFKNQPGG